jgi:carboxymethylenebutenolidase
VNARSPIADTARCAWYGLPPLAHRATRDAAFALSDVDRLEATFKAAGVSYTGYRYLARHAFANETAVGPARLPITQYDAGWAPGPVRPGPRPCRAAAAPRCASPAPRGAAS